MKIELHILQNFAPSNLNRDDTNAPKDCEFGGVRRARVSSQCLKRAIRTNEIFSNTLKSSDSEQDVSVGKRTRLLKDQIIAILGLQEDLKDVQKTSDKEKTAKTENSKKLDDFIKAAVKTAIDDSDATKMLIHYDDSEIKMLANLFSKVLSGEKKPEEAAKEFKPKSKASDIALFGRMVAENTDFNVDAACQVAHAISTNKVSMEMDYFTAIDDLKKDFASEDAGAGMIGTVEFNSACFYRYSVVDTNQLKANLDGDNELSKKTVRAFIESSIAAIPTGKQNSMAAQNPPSFVMAVVKDSCAPWSLANAFEKPVGPGQNGLVVSSIERFDDYWGRLVSVYSNDGVKTAVLFTTENVDLKNLASSRVSGKKELVEKIIGAIY